MITFKQKGDFRKTENFLTGVKNSNYLSILDRYGREGVLALSSATPTDSGKTASCWAYKVVIKPSYSSISWYNTNDSDGVNVAILLQYGHGTGTGGYVRGIDYINPAMKPIFDQIVSEAWKEVTSL